MLLLHPQRSIADLAKDGSVVLHDIVDKGECRNFPKSPHLKCFEHGYYI